MATKMKVYEIAKSLNRPSKELVQALNENGYEVKSHNSNIEDDAIAFIIKNFKPLPENSKSETKDSFCQNLRFLKNQSRLSGLHRHHQSDFLKIITIDYLIQNRT